MSAENPAFSSRLRQATRADHTDAESSEFITSLMEGARSGADYVLLLAQYRPLYAALESATARWRHEPAVADLFDPALDRLAALDADLPRLAEWAGLPEVPAVVPAAEAYARRITATGAMNDPGRLVAHHYLRYLGDLSGGQAIGALVARHYGVPADLLRMWEFPSIPKPKPYKDRYRGLLDAFAAQHDGDAVVHEAALGFRLNRDVFGELSRRSPQLATV